MTDADDAAEQAYDGVVEPVDVGTEPADGGAGTSRDPFARPGPASRLRFSIAWAIVVVTLDQWSKHWALNALGNGRSRHVIWTLQWNLTFNSGMAFSRGQGVGPYIGVIALVVIVVMLLGLRRGGGMVSMIAVGLVVGGAIGNIADRLFRGRAWLHGSVIDFIDFRWWPIFNVADMGVTIGGALLVLSALLQSRKVSR
jgi:signal peptidase II